MEKSGRVESLRVSWRERDLLLFSELKSSIAYSVFFYMIPLFVLPRDSLSLSEVIFKDHSFEGHPVLERSKLQCEGKSLTHAYLHLRFGAYFWQPSIRKQPVVATFVPPSPVCKEEIIQPLFFPGNCDTPWYKQREITFLLNIPKCTVSSNILRPIMTWRSMYPQEGQVAPIQPFPASTDLVLPHFA